MFEQILNSPNSSFIRSAWLLLGLTNVMMALTSGDRSQRGYREKRFLYLDTTNNIDVSLQITVPFGVALPTVKKTRRSSRSHLFTSRDLGDEGHVYSQQLARLDYYFEYLEVATEECREKLVCELSAEPDEFYPIADIFLKQLKIAVSSDDVACRYCRYKMALLFGSGHNTSSGGCNDNYQNCKLEATKLFNMDAINFWKFLASIFNFKFSE